MNVPKPARYFSGGEHYYYYNYYYLKRETWFDVTRSNELILSYLQATSTLPPLGSDVWQEGLTVIRRWTQRHTFLHWTEPVRFSSALPFSSIRHTKYLKGTLLYSPLLYSSCRGENRPNTGIVALCSKCLNAGMRIISQIMRVQGPNSRYRWPGLILSPCPRPGPSHLAVIALLKRGPILLRREGKLLAFIRILLVRLHLLSSTLFSYSPRLQARTDHSHSHNSTVQSASYRAVRSFCLTRHDASEARSSPTHQTTAIISILVVAIVFLVFSSWPPTLQKGPGNLHSWWEAQRLQFQWAWQRAWRTSLFEDILLRRLLPQTVK